MPPAPAPDTGAEALLRIEDLSVHFPTPKGPVRAVQGLSLDIPAGKTVAVVGESGSGKSVSSLAIMRLLPDTVRFPTGRILFRGEDLLTKSQAEMRRIRGNAIGMVFQEPMTSLNPVHTVGDQIAETVRLHRGLSKRAASAEAVAMLDLVNIPEPQRRARSYPHEMSGGMRQRAMIAMALACRPQLLIADEPTTALDVTIQAQILDLIQDLQAELGMAVLFVTHDLGVVAEIADHVVVMYGGRAVETGTVQDIFAQPRMPYTAGLMASIPRLGHRGEGRLPAIPGSVPDPFSAPPGCYFAPRCGHAEPACDAAVPALDEASPGHRVRCRRWPELSLKGVEP